MSPARAPYEFFSGDIGSMSQKKRLSTKSLGVSDNGRHIKNISQNLSVYQQSQKGQQATKGRNHQRQFPFQPNDAQKSSNNKGVFESIYTNNLSYANSNNDIEKA